jgi:hypothetical protein
MDTPDGPLPQPETCWREAARAVDAAARESRKRMMVRRVWLLMMLKQVRRETTTVVLYPRTTRQHQTGREAISFMSQAFTAFFQAGRWSRQCFGRGDLPGFPLWAL